MPLRSRPIVQTALFLALCVTPACVPGCRERAPVPTPPPAPAPAPPVVQAPTPPSVPPTVSVLRRTPEAATLAVAFPSSGVMLDEWLGLVERFAPDPDRLQAGVKEALRRGAQELEAPEAQSFAELLRDQGIDPAAPAGLFIDTDPMAQAYRDALGALSDRPRPWQPLSGEEPEPKRVEIDATPVWAAVMRYADAARAEGAARAFAARAAEEDARDGRSSGVLIHVLSTRNIGHFVRDGWLVLGNSEEFLAQVAQRFEKPVAVRYGTEEVPARETDDAVALVRADKLGRLMRAVLPMIALARPGLAPWIELQYPLLERTAEAYSADPVVVTLERTGNRIELLSRLDYSRHLNLEKLFGVPAPLRLATVLPAESRGMLSLRITDETKDALESAWFAGLRENRIKDTQVVMSLQVLKLLMSLTRNNLALGVTGVRKGWPLGVVALEVEDPDSTKAFLTTMGLTLEPVETHRDADIMQVPLPLAAGLYYAFSGNVMLLSDDLALLRESVDLAQSETPSPLYAKLDPPFDPADPRYNALLLTNGFFTDVLRPLVASPGRADQDPVVEIVTRIADSVQQVRASRSVRGPWREGRVTVYLGQ